MRAALVPLLLAASLLAPAASAAPPILRATAPAEVEGPADVRVLVELELRDFWCPDGARVNVTLDAWGEGASVQPSSTKVVLVIDDTARFGAPWRTSANATFSVAAEPGTEGVVEVLAKLAPVETCFAPGWTEEATANVSIVVRAAPPAPAPPEPAPATPEPATNETQPAPAEPETNETEPQPEESVERRPEGEGFIGDYRPDTPNAGVPAPGAALLIAAAAALALLHRRKR